MMNTSNAAKNEIMKDGKSVSAQIYDMLNALPAEVEREYELTVVEYAIDWDETVIKEYLAELVELVKTNTDDQSEKNKVAFNAFCVLVNHERRMKNSTAEQNLLNEYGEYFKSHVFYNHLLLLSKMNTIDSVKQAAELEEILLLARKNAYNLINNVGGKHAYAETVVLAYEKKSDLMSKLQSDTTKESINWLEEATTAINIAIDRIQYPKFYCTYGRLLAIKGKYDEALKQINIAIDKEDNEKKDYSIRIAQYLNFYQQVVANKQISQMEETFEKKMSDYEMNVHKKMQEYETKAAETLTEYKLALDKQEKQTIVKNMEFLGLFSGIVSFTIGSLTITGAIASQSILNAAGLIIVLMGALMVVFASFGIILHGIEKKTALRNVVVFAAGLVAILSAFVFCLK